MSNSVSLIIACLALTVVPSKSGEDPAEHAKREHVKVYQQGCTATLMATYPWIDENGGEHYSDPNTTCCTYTCEKGHSWAVCR